MPIQVHCPNPDCARVHLVKDQYAGQRGKCPRCAHWMYVPRLDAAAVPTKRVPALVEDKPKPRRAPEPEPLDEVQDAPAKKPSSFGWAATVFLLLGVMGLVALSLTPFLPQTSISATGEFSSVYKGRKPTGIDAESALYVTVVPLAACLFPLGALLAGLVARRPNFSSIALAYISVSVASAFAFMALWHFRDEQTGAAKMEESIQRSKEAGKQGEAIVHRGLYLPVGLGGAAGAAVLFLFAAFALHRRWWSRILAVLILGFPLAVGSLWVYREPLGIADWFPDIPAITAN